MLTRSVYVKLVIFVLITLVGISYISAKYIGLFNNLFGSTGCTISADFPDSGGIFTNAEVTYRGVAIGRVGTLHLIKDGVRVDLHIDDCNNPKIPVDTKATVSDRSVIGEQYVNLIPANNNPPYMHGGVIIAMKDTTIPVSAQELLANLDALSNSVDTQKLATVIGELGTAFGHRGADLGTLLDASSNLLKAAEQNLGPTLQLIDRSKQVLQTQLDLSDPLNQFTKNLNLLSQQFVKSDPDIRHLLNTGPSDLSIVQSFVQDNQTDLGVALADLASTGQVLARHVDGIEQILELYPALVAGGSTVIQKDGVGALSLVVNPGIPPDCGNPTKGSEGYEGTEIRKPSDLTPAAPNVSAHCTAPLSSGTNVRGSANIPGGDPISATGGGIAYPRANTANTVSVGTSLNNAGVLADDSWIAILTDSLN